MRAAGYIRVSSAEQVENWSLDAQRRSIADFCHSKGWELVGLYREEGASAWAESSEQRPQFQRLLADADQRALDVVVVHSLDRWSRNLRLTLETFRLLSDRRVAFASVTENIDYSTPEGRLFIAMLGAFAQYYSDSLAKHTSKGRRERFLSGLPNGDIPFGYEANGDGVPVPVAEEASAVSDVFERYATGGYSLEQLASWLNDRGFRTRNKQHVNGPAGPRPFTKETLKDMVHNPFYAGCVTYKGSEKRAGVHEAIVGEELWERCQNVARSRRWGGGTPSDRTYLLRGLSRCIFCGQKLWAHALPAERRYYREPSRLRRVDCPAAGAWVRAERLDVQMDQVITALRLPDDWRDAIEAEVEKSLGRDLRPERDRLRERLRRYARIYAEGYIDEVEYQTVRAALERDIAALERSSLPDVERAGHMLRDFPALWEAAKPAERHQLLRATFSAVYCDPAEGVVVGVTPRAPFTELFSLCEGLLMPSPREIEPPRDIPPGGCSSWRPRGDSNPRSPP
jgi:site-specific DNA recombinase